MLVNIASIQSINQDLLNPHKGIVMDNKDPLKLGRIKCIVEDLFNETDYESLPWVYPMNDLGHFSVPDIHSEVIITFPYRDIYFPFYKCNWESKETHNIDFDENYPNTYGWEDSKGNRFKVNKTTGIVEFLHHSGTYVKITNDGKVTIQKGAENLTDLIKQLCDACENITVMTGIGVQPVLNKPTFTTLAAKIGDFVE